MKEKTPKIPFAERAGQAIDKLVSIFSPKAGAYREACRAAQKMFTSYRGADSTRLNDGWLASPGSADQDIINNLPTLRQRSRDLNRNAPFATGITATMTTNTVGAGIKPQSRLDPKKLKLSQKDIVDYQNEIDAVWTKWVPFADASQRLNFYGIQQLVHRQVIENGEIFLIPVMLDLPYRPYNLAYQLIEADRVGTPFNFQTNPAVRAGIEIGKEFGEPINYYVREVHPGDITLRFLGSNPLKFRTYPAFNPETGRKNINHLYFMLRPQQTRGVPFFAPVISYFQHLDKYLEAELVAARVAACFALFITKTSPQDAIMGVEGRQDSEGKKINNLEPGMIEYLAQGESINQFNPQRPGGTFETFVMQLLRSISSALNLPYELVAKDFTRSNYSNMRASLLQAYRYFKTHQQWMNDQLNQPTFEMVIEEAVLNGDLKLPNFFQNKALWCATRWIAEGWEWVDPLKEAQASVLAHDNNFTTLQDVAAGRGQDWEEVLEQRARELQRVKELEDEYEVKFTVQPAPPQLEPGAPKPSKLLPEHPAADPESGDQPVATGGGRVNE